MHFGFKYTLSIAFISSKSTIEALEQSVNIFKLAVKIERLQAHKLHVFFVEARNNHSIDNVLLKNNQI